MSVLGEVITTARRARGYTQEDLARLSGVTQAALSRYESDLREPDGEVLVALANALGVTPAFLAHAGRTRGGMAIDAHMRRRATAKPTVWRRLESELNMTRMHASLLFEEVSLRAEQQIPAIDTIDTTPADAARMVRMQWRLPSGPVRQLVRWLESAGCLVIERDLGTTRVDGLSQWVADHPVMLLNRQVPIDRKRLTMAHELGHLVLHAEHVSDDVEREANEFAAEFLMPEAVIRSSLRNLKIGRLHDLKREWGVSMQALIERAHRLGTIRPSERTNLYKGFSARGWRINEPGSDELPPESPGMAAMIGRTLSERGLSAAEIASLAGFADSDRNDLFPVPGSGLRVV